MNRDFKGIWIPKEIWLSDEMTTVEKVIFAEINSLDGPDGCFASNEYLSKKIGVNISTVTRAISHLKEIGLIRHEGFDGRTRILKTDPGVCPGSIGNLHRQPGQIEEAASAKSAFLPYDNKDEKKEEAKEGPARLLFKLYEKRWAKYPSTVYHEAADSICKRVAPSESELVEIVESTPRFEWILDRINALEKKRMPGLRKTRAESIRRRISELEAIRLGGSLSQEEKDQNLRQEAMLRKEMGELK